MIMVLFFIYYPNFDNVQQTITVHPKTDPLKGFDREKSGATSRNLENPAIVSHVPINEIP